MSTLPHPDAPAIFWIDATGEQQGPESLTTVVERIAHQQIPAETPVWYQGAVNWAAFDSNPELAAVLHARLAPTAAPMPDPVTVPESSDVFAAPSTNGGGSLFAGPAPVAEAAPAAEIVSPFSVPAPSEHVDAPLGADAFSSPPIDAGGFASPVVVDPMPAAAMDVPVILDPSPFAPADVAPAEMPAPPAEPVTPMFESTATFDAPSAPVTPMFESTGTFGTPATADETPAVAVPDVVMPDTAPAAAVEPAGLRLGDPATLDAAWDRLSRRSDAYEAEYARAAQLDTSLAATVRGALTGLGFVIDDEPVSDDYHTFRLTEPDGATASLAIQRIAPAHDVATALERPAAVYVDRARRVSVGLFLADYVDAEGSFDSTTFGSDLAAIVNAAGSA